MTTQYTYYTTTTLYTSAPEGTRAIVAEYLGQPTLFVEDGTFQIMHSIKL